MTIRKFYSTQKPIVKRYPKIIAEYGYDASTRSIVQIGNKDIVAFVNAPARDTLLVTKMQRYLAGDLTALGNGTAKGIYTDIAGMPTDYNTLSNVFKKVNSFVKGNGFNTVTDLFNDIYSNISKSKNSVVENKNKEVKTDES